MPRAEPPASHRAYRHLLTSAAGGRLGGPGFQTVAAAATLGPEVIEQLEKEVGFFALPEGDGGHPALQLRRWDDHFLLLTRYQASGEGGDGRRGNYLAESLLVPTAWLAAGDWDVAAAFAAIDWWGADRTEQLADGAQPLEEEELPPLAGGALSRLAELAERAPGELLDHLLLALVGWASRGERLLVVEARAERPEEIEAVISLLPLALPPSCRFTRRGGRRRGIELRTRGPARGMPEVDLAGVAAGDLDAAEEAGATVIDLGGRLPLDEQPDLEGYDYAQWAGSAIREGRWQEIEEVYARAAEVPVDELFRHFAEWRRGVSERGGDGAPQRPAAVVAAEPKTRRRRGQEPARPALRTTPSDQDLPGDAPPGVVSERRERWQGRRSLEAAAARGHDAWRGEVTALVGALEEENRRALEDLRGELDAVGERLLERLRSEREALLEETRRAFESEALEAQRRLHRDLERSLDQVREEGDELLRQMRRDAGQRERRLATSAASTTAGGRAGGAARRRGGWAASWQRGGKLPWVAMIAAGVALVALLAWAGWRFWGPDEDEPTIGAVGPTVSVATDVDLLGRFADGATAGRLLLRARDRPGLAEPAATTALTLLLGEVPPPGETERCLLLQAALHRRGLGGPLAVDGDCGPATGRTLGEAVTGSCCADLPAADTARRSSCFLATGFALPETERCSGADPLAAEREWTSAEAANVLGLARAAAETAEAAARPAAVELVRRLDLVASPEIAGRVAALPVSSAEAALLLELARELAAAGGQEAADDRQVAALLDEIGAPASAASDRAPTAPPGDG